MPSYNMLCFNSLTVQKTPFHIEAALKCPNCQTKFKPKHQIASMTATFNFNQLVTFTCTNCASTIEFYIAVHNDPTNGLTWVIQRGDSEAIESNWWLHRGVKGIK